ncbi:MAG: YbaN family protein [Bacteroidales bacterium]|nr:YbaN family protein [Bacteroidales bacterium]
MANKKLSTVARSFLIIAGLLSVSFGILGVFLPLLPTTPFLLLSAYCFIRSSDRLYAWLLSNKFLGHYIQNYIENRAIEPRVKWFTIALLWGSILTTVITLNFGIWIKVLLVVIAVGVTFHILSMRGKKCRR